MPLPAFGASGAIATPAAASQPTGGTYSGPNIIQGPLNFQPGSDYNSAYNSALKANQTNYNNILAGYQQTMATQVSAQDAVKQGYTDLANNVLAGIQGVGDSQRQAIRDAYAQQAGRATQGLTSAGLGNTTVAASVQRGLVADREKANVNLANQLAQLSAGYQSQLGLAGLGYTGNAVAANTALGVKQLDWMNSVNSPYPNASAYAQLAQQQGAAQQAASDRAMQQQYLDQLRGNDPPRARQFGGGAPGLGYTPTANYTPSAPSGGYFGSGGGIGGGAGFGYGSTTPSWYTIASDQPAQATTDDWWGYNPADYAGLDGGDALAAVVGNAGAMAQDYGWDYGGWDNVFEGY